MFGVSRVHGNCGINHAFYVLPQDFVNCPVKLRYCYFRRDNCPTSRFLQFQYNKINFPNSYRSLSLINLLFKFIQLEPTIDAIPHTVMLSGLPFIGNILSNMHEFLPKCLKSSNDPCYWLT